MYKNLLIGILLQYSVLDRKKNPSRSDLLNIYVMEYYETIKMNV